MTEGGTLGFYCQHAYAHTNDNHRNSLPYALKGVDAMFYSIFHHMGLEVQVRPVMKDLPDDEYLEYLKYEDPELRTQPGARSRLTGTELHGLTLSNNGRFEGSPPPMMIVCESWQSKWCNSVVWFNEPGPSEVAMVHLAYGNEPSLK